MDVGSLDIQGLAQGYLLIKHWNMIHFNINVEVFLLLLLRFFLSTKPKGIPKIVCGLKHSNTS